MDITRALQRDHDQALQLARELCDEDGDAAARRDIFRTLKQAILAHARAEENVVYTVLKDFEDDRKAIQLGYEGEVEHQLIDYLLDRLTRSSATTSPNWTAHAIVLKELLEHHIEEEQDELFEKLREHMDQRELDEMGAEFEAAKTRLKSPAKARTA